MLTIFEGPDGGGKSTFGRWYCDHAFTAFQDDPVVTHNHGPYLGQGDIAHLYWKTIEKARAAYHVFADRSWIAEPIYSAAFRREPSRIPIAYRRMLERGAWTARTVVVLFLPPLEVCEVNFARRQGEEYLSTVADLRDVYYRYTWLLNGAEPMDLPYVVADYTRHRRDAIADMIEAVRPPADGCGFGGGRFDPGRSVLIVGDRPGPFNPKHGDRGVPFVQFQSLGCSVWLAEQLEEAGIPESDLYWINAYSRDGRPVSPFFLEALQPPLVIALGQNAGEWTDREANIEATVVEHPQHWKRFHYNSEKQYPLITEISQYRSELTEEL
jgi:thymidylate kinase